MKKPKLKMRRLRCPKWLKRCAKRIWVLGVTLVVLSAILLTVFRALTPWAAQYKETVETQLSRFLGTKVSIQDMKTSWYWFEPVLKLDGIQITETNNTVLNVKELLVGIDLMRSFWHWRIQPGVLFVEDATFNFREDNAHWQLDGVALNSSSKAVPQAEYSTVSGWLLAYQKIVMKRIGMTLHWKDGRVTSIKPLNLVAVNRDGHYKVKGHARLVGDNPSVLSVLADLNIASGFSSNVQGQLYLSVEQINFSEWRPVFPAFNLEVTKGLGEGQLWLDIRNSRLVSAQSAVRVRDVLWRQEQNKAAQKIDRLSVNMAWEETAKGWRWTADHVRLRANKTTWPENDLAITYDSNSAQYKVFVKTLLLEPTRALLHNAPDALKPLFEINPRGLLNNTQFELQDGKISYFLSRFSQLSWDAKDALPAVNHLSGALAWEPKEGHLNLDGEAVTLTFKNKPPLQVELLNASILWKALSQGWRVTLDRGVVKHEHGVLNARGFLDDVSADTLGTIQGNLSFSMHDATFWWPYLPEKGLKPKLKTWLEKDVTRIEQFSGQMQVHGALEAFPYDKKPGEFLVTGALSGVDLRFNHDWPLTKEITGTVQLDKRLLMAEIEGADFQGIPMHSARLTVADLGLNHEVMFTHGEARAPLEEMQAYIRQSPLHTKLKKLDALILKQPANLDLAIQFPFYPGGGKLKVKGLVTLQANDLFLKEVPQRVGLHDLSGELKFNEQGVVDSHLSARLFDEPMALWVRSNHEGASYFAIDMEGYLSALGLREAISSPMLSLVRGRTPIKAELKMTEEPNDLDHVHLTSSLDGLSIDLPKPFGKKCSGIMPFTVDTYFNFERGMRLKINYDRRLSTDLWFSGRPSALKLRRGEVVLGGGDAVLRDKPGASIRGEFKAFDWVPWASVLDKLQLKNSHQSKDYLHGFRTISIDFGKAEFLKQQYQNIHFYAQRLPENVWSMTMKEDVIFAELKYAPHQNMLSGYVSSWQFDLPDVEASGAPTRSKTAWKPGQIPNLKLKVGTLQVGDVNAGQLSLKGTQIQGKAWRLDSGKLKSDAYELVVKGEWQAKPKPETKLDAQVTISDLKKALAHWHGSPVVEAHDGDIRLLGEWDGAPNDFSVKGLSGQLQIAFKEGRIPNLSPETEKKMVLGKLLSILSLQTIPRRLKLDFSDLAKPGYSF
ncbi:MAG: hypothetical protein K0U52_04965, partial [Gammaproteobacteria bacterium]|nr:hypothetical protein [Gammaproteobacteria bacterium]